ncbi:MAG: protease complex subunit PrcB family protein [Gammaproteobacteria bacterium]|nr:protease complex subunit PrcB family protein [Gammaproteobacteria bacterium]
MDFRKQIIVLSLIFPLLAGCVGDSNAESPIPLVNFTVIVFGDSTMSSLPENKKIEVFTDQTSLNSSLAVYVQLVAEHTVDFSSRRVALLSMGGRSSGGYEIATDRIEDHGDFMTLKILLTKPGSGCVTTGVITSPYEFVEIESTKELVIEERVVVVECS